MIEDKIPMVLQLPIFQTMLYYLFIEINDLLDFGYKFKDKSVGILFTAMVYLQIYNNNVPLPAHSQQFPIANASFARSISFSVCVSLDNFSITP